MRYPLHVIPLLIVLLVAGCAGGVGHAAPEFSKVDLAGAPVSLAAYRGEVVLLDFWATWCPPCVTSSPAIQRLHERFADRGLRVIAPHYDGKGDPARYMAEHGYTYTVLPDANDVCKAFGVTQIPTFIIIGTDGTIIHRQTGFSAGDEETMAAIIDEELTPRM